MDTCSGGSAGPGPTDAPNSSCMAEGWEDPQNCDAWVPQILSLLCAVEQCWVSLHGLRACGMQKDLS